MIFFVELYTMVSRRLSALEMEDPKGIKFVVPQFSEFHKGRTEREAARK